MPITIQGEQGIFMLSGGDVSYVLFVTGDRRLMNLYWGRRVPPGAIPASLSDYPGFVSFDLPAAWQPAELPTLGTGWYGTPALDVLNADGDHVVDLRVKTFRVFPGKTPLSGLPAVYCEAADEAQSLEIDMEDEVTGLSVTARYTVFEAGGAIARSLLIRNSGGQAVELRGAMAASCPLWGGGYDALHLKGAWARERNVVRTPVGEGEYRISSQRGASGHEENPFLALCAKETTENQGNGWAVNLLYSGSFLACAAVDNAGNTRLSMGLNPQVFSWRLMPNESFQTPEAVLVYSDRGLNGMSQIFHSLYRTRLARGYWRDRERPILINNWEATYFDFHQDKILQIAKAAKELGIELFVLDDGWFGKRDSDNCSLGDWTENRRKLPDGLSGLSDRLHGMGMMFGLWVEPEMISPDSDLYRAHPDWCLSVRNRPRTLERNQLVLDLSRKDVQDYIIEAMRGVLSRGKVDYIKWDMNRNMTEYFSAAREAGRQMETQHRYILGLYRVLDALTAAFPRVLFESCSGGGGRFDGGMLYYMPQTWTSDNTDAVSRLAIQYGTSMVYPVSAMGAHVSAVPNHQCERTASMKMRGDVALSGNFGFELDLTRLDEADLNTVKELVSTAKKLRGLTQRGVFSRLVAPGGGRYAAWQFVSADGREALLCVYQILSVPNQPPLRVQMTGLDEQAYYREDNPEDAPAPLSGAALMSRGMSVSLKGDFSSRLIHFVKDAAT